MAAKYDGFTTFEQQQMANAFQRMQRASAAAKKALLGGDLAAFQKWFDGTGKNAHLMKVSTIVNEVDQAILSRPITFAKLDRPGVRVDTRNLCGYVWLIQQGGQAFHVGTGMRIMVVWSTHIGQSVDYMAQTMYHELTHKVGSTNDSNYNEQACLGYAKTAPHMAANNAENFNLFLREYL
ncbi:MAG: M35 family metallo-endopeptidase [Planctomycetota bacterium]